MKTDREGSTHGTVVEEKNNIMRKSTYDSPRLLLIPGGGLVENRKTSNTSTATAVNESDDHSNHHSEPEQEDRKVPVITSSEPESWNGIPVHDITDLKRCVCLCVRASHGHSCIRAREWGIHNQDMHAQEEHRQPLVQKEEMQS